MAPEGDSRDLASATSPATDTNMAHGSRYFNFLGLPRELRDMVYDQFHRLHPDTPMFREAGKPELMESKPVKTKPITSLLLVNKQIGSEYRDVCEKRPGVIVSTYSDFLVLGSGCEEKIVSLDNEKGDEPEWSLSPLEDWLAHWDSQLPKLDSITVSIYLNHGDIVTAAERCKFEQGLEDFVSIPKLRELKVIVVDDADDWDRSNAKQLLVHWTSSSARKPTLIGSPQRYVETCCDHLGPFKSFIADCSSDSDDSSSHSNDGDDGDEGNDSDDDGDDFGSSDENENSGNGTKRDMDDGDEEVAEDEDKDGNEDPDGSGSGDDDTTNVPKTKQSPSYFDFFGLPPEIRDMIYDQPEIFDHETPLCLHGDTLDLHYPSSRMAATKPRTSLLLLNTQFSSEYKKRCEGHRSGLFISEKLEHFTMATANMAIPQKAAKDATFMHIHAGEWCNPAADLFATRMDLMPFGRWLCHYVSRMPKLENVSINLYTTKENVEQPTLRDEFVRYWASFINVRPVTDLRLIVMEEPRGWLLWRSKSAVKTLLAHWKRGKDVSPLVMDPRVSYEENCCDGSLASDIVEEKKVIAHPDYHSEEGDERLEISWD